MMEKSKNKFICQWSLEIIYGKQSEAVKILKSWGEEKISLSGFRLSHTRQNRMMNGYAGASPSYIIDEYIFDTMDDFEKALSDMSEPQFKKYSDALAPFVVPGSQKWTIFKMID